MDSVCFLKTLGKHSVFPQEKLKEKSTLTGDLTNGFSGLTKGADKAEPDPSQPCTAMSGCGYKLEKGRYSDSLFPNESGRTRWQGLKDFVKPPSPEIFRCLLDTACSDNLWAAPVLYSSLGWRLHSFTSIMENNIRLMSQFRRSFAAEWQQDTSPSSNFHLWGNPINFFWRC